MILNRRLDQAEHHGTTRGALRSVRKQEVLPVNDKGLYDSLRTVVGNLQPAIFQIIRQI